MTRTARCMLRRLLTSSVAGVGWLLAAPALALATQKHGDPEGIITHQLAHLFFMFSMGTLIYWLRQRQLVQEAGWRLIQYAAFFFILWNIDAFLAHYLDEQSTLLSIRRIGVWQMEISGAPEVQWLGWVYFFAKLDHLLCVPAMAFLFLGLRQLYKTTDSAPEPPS